MSTTAAWIVLAGIPALPALITLVNLVTWRRAVRSDVLPGSTSVLVPARNEESNIEACLRAAAASNLRIDEILVYDDQSGDATPRIVTALMSEIPQLHLLAGDGVPRGWVGKPHACHQLGAAARGDTLVFVDADVRLEPEGLARLAHTLVDADVVSAFPRQQTVTWAERLMVPLLSVTYVSWLPLRLVRMARDPRLTAANGQILAVRREAYERLGGFASVRSEIVDDVAFVRRAKSLGLRAAFVDGDRIGTCRMYRSAADIWRGFSKNLYEGIGESTGALVAVSLAYSLAFVVPYVALASAAASTSRAWMAPALVGVGLNLLLRLAVSIRFRHGIGSIVFHPVAVVALLCIALNSYRWSRYGTLQWGGRTYASRAERETS